MGHVETEKLPPGRILLVDDEESVVKIVTQVLKRWGFDVLIAHDGHEALELFSGQTHQIDCVLLDLTMPRLNGAEAFRQMRELNPEVKVIISSGFDEMQVKQSFKGQGIAGFLQKPYSLTELKAKLGEVLKAPSI